MEVEKLKVVIEADTGDAKKIDGVKTSIDGVTDSTEKLNTSLKKLAIAGTVSVAIKKLVDISKDCINAIGVQIEAERKLETVMRQRMGSTDGAIQAIKDYTAELQGMGVVGDEVAMAGAQQLATFLNSETALKTLIPAMENLAVQQNGVNVTGENMVSIGNMMGKVMQGQISALSRVGITFSEAEAQILQYGNEQERASILAQIITNNVGQMNSALANTPSGAIQQLANDFGDLKESIGSALAPAIVPVIKFIDALVVKLQTAMLYVRAFMELLFGTAPSVSTSSIGKTASTATDLAGSMGDAASSGQKVASSTKKASKSLGDASKKAKKTAKELRNLAGIDELNIFSSTPADTSATPSATPSVSPSVGGSGGGVGGIDLGGAGGLGDLGKLDTSGLELASKRLEEIKAKVEPVVKVFKILFPIIAGVVAGFVAFKVITSLGSIFTNIKNTLSGLWTVMMANPVALVIAIIVGLVVAFITAYKTNDEFREKVDKAFAKIKEVVKDAIEKVKTHLTNFKEGLSNAIKKAGELKDKVVEKFKEIATKVKDKVKEIKDNVVNGFKNFVTGAKDKVTEMKTKVVDGFKNLVDNAKTKVNDMKTKVVEGFKNLVDGAKTKVNDMKTAVSNKFNEIKTAITTKVNEAKTAVSNKFNEIKTAISTKINEAKTTVTTKFTEIKTTISNKIGEVKTAVSTKFTEIKTTMSTKVEEAKTAVSTKFDNIKTAISSKLSDVKAKVSSIFSNIYTTMTSKIESAKQKVSNIIDTIKSKFNFTAQFKIKLPHLSVTGGEAPFGIGGKGSLPKFSVDWYAKGGIMDGAQLFGMAGNTLLGGGEAGREAILPLERNTEWMDNIANKVVNKLAVSTTNNQPIEITLNVGGAKFGKVCANSINQAQRQSGAILLNI